MKVGERSFIEQTNAFALQLKYKLSQKFMRLGSLLTALFLCCHAQPAMANNANQVTLANINIEKLPKGTQIVNNGDGSTTFKLIPQEADQNWSLSVSDLTNTTLAQYSKIQTQIVMVLEGKLKVALNDKETILSAGQCVVIPAGVIHSFKPIKGLCRLAEINLNNKDLPADTTFVSTPPTILGKVESKNKTSEIYVDQTVDSMIESLRGISAIDPKYYVFNFESGDFSAKEILPGAVEGGKWSIALIQLTDVPRHFHKKITETFIVVNGILEIEVDDKIYTLLPGNIVNIPLSKKHYLKSGSDQPVRVLCIDSPAFDPTDHHLCE